jgi:hypothetical protein
MPDESPAGPPQDDGGCAVDWSWLAGREIAAAESDLQSLRLTFRDGQTLVVRAALFQGTPFLSFTPWCVP